MTALLCDTIRGLAQRKLPSHDQLTRNELMTEAYQPTEGFVDEVWLPVPGWEEAYKVSDQGRVKSLDRMCTRGGGKGDVLKKGIVLRPEIIGRRGYSRIKLQAAGKAKYAYVHDLVLQAFSTPCSSGYEICHLDGKAVNNSVNNLECVRITIKPKLKQEKRQIESEEKKKCKINAAKIKAFRKELDSAIKRTHGYLPSQNELDAAFVYENGRILWKEDRGNHIKAGTHAGTVRREGYVHISFKGRVYPAHRLIWVMHGNAPAETIDHINRNPGDNRIENLRAATKGQQLFNTGLRSNNKSGVKGVSWHTCANAWRGQIYFQGKSYHAGIFKNKDECIEAARVLRERLHGEFACHAVTF